MSSVAAAPHSMHAAAGLQLETETWFEGLTSYTTPEIFVCGPSEPESIDGASSTDNVQRNDRSVMSAVGSAAVERELLISIACLQHFLDSNQLPKCQHVAIAVHAAMYSY